MEIPLIHQLSYSWTGWPKSSAFPPAAPAGLFPPLDAAWAADGLARIAHRWSPDRIQMTFDAGPDLAPTTIAARAKGRLDHALRQAGWRHGFSRKISLRALGENTLDIVLAYIATQLDRAELADPRYLDSLADAAWKNPAFDLADPSPSAHGRYWFDLHLVAVTDSRWRVGREDFLDRIRPCVLAWGDSLATGSRDAGRSPGVRSLAVMPDHIHLAIRGPLDRSPADLAEDLWRHLNRAAGCRLFSDEIYVGTFSEYPLAAIRPRS